MARSAPSDLWRELASAIYEQYGEWFAPADALAAFAGSKLASKHPLAQHDAERFTPKHMRDELTRAFLFARLQSAIEDPQALNAFAKQLGALALTPLGVAAIEAEAARLASAK